MGHDVVGDGPNEIPGEEKVAYQAMYTSERFGLNHRWSRTPENFFEDVEWEGSVVPRFTHVMEPGLPTEHDPLGLVAETIYEDDDRSIAFIVLNGANKVVRNHTMTLQYEVLAGTGVVDIESEVFPLYPGVTLTIPPGVFYQDDGKLVMLATSTPPFDAANVEFAPLDRTGYHSIRETIAHVKSNLIELHDMCVERNLSSRVEATLRANLEDELAYWRTLPLDSPLFDDRRHHQDEHLERGDFREQFAEEASGK